MVINFNISKENIKNYMYINIVALLLSVYVIFFPFFSKLLNLISKDLTKCTYKSLSGKNCPLCGGTTYIEGLYSNFINIKYWFNPFGFMIIFILFEISFRIFCLSKIYKQKINNKIIYFDIIIHSLFLVLFLGYEMYFILNN